MHLPSEYTAAGGEDREPLGVFGLHECDVLLILEFVQGLDEAAAVIADAGAEPIRAVAAAEVTADSPAGNQ